MFLYIRIMVRFSLIKNFSNQFWTGDDYYYYYLLWIIASASMLMLTPDFPICNETGFLSFGKEHSSSRL